MFMGKYSAEQKAASIARAHELLAGVDAQLAIADTERTIRAARAERGYSPGPSSMQSFGRLPLLSAEPMNRWRREQEELEAKRNREKNAMTDAEQAKQWAEWADARIARALAEHDRLMNDVLGQVIAEERKSMRDYVAEQIGKLRAELNVAKAHESGKILDLPALSGWRRYDAA
jgi:hypothetical protein